MTYGKVPVLLQFNSASLSTGVIGYGTTGLSFRQLAEHRLASIRSYRDPTVCRGHQGFLRSQVGISQSAGQAGALTTGTEGGSLTFVEAMQREIAVGKTVFRILAYISVVITTVGVVLPLLPTTPFVLLAAFFASKGSPELAQWLEGHPNFGQAIEQWRTGRVVPAQAKILACSMMANSWTILIFSGMSGLILAITGV